MNNEMDALYRETILDHYQSPRGKGTIATPTHCADGKNPLCGDEISMQLDIADQMIRDVKWDGHGCSICMASASMLAEQLVGKPLGTVEQLSAAFVAMMHSKSIDASVDFGDLTVLEGIKKFPVRIKCALLPWTTLSQALAHPKG